MSSKIEIISDSYIGLSQPIQKNSSTEPLDEDFVSKAIRIVKLSITKGDVNILHTQLPPLVTSSTLTLDAIRALIKQVKDIASSTDNLPLIYRQLILDLNLKDQYQFLCDIPDFQTFDEEFRIACLKLDAEKNSSPMSRHICLNIQKYGIKNKKILTEMAKDLVQKGLMYAINFSQSIKNWDIDDQKARIEIAKILAQRYGKILSQYIKNYNIDDEEALIKIARLAAKQSGATMLVHLPNYSIKNEKKRLEIAYIAMQKEYGFLLENLTRILDNCDFNLENRVLLFMYAMHLFPMFIHYVDVFFPDKDIALKYYPELRALGLKNVFDIPQFLSDFWGEENVSYAVIVHLREEYRKNAEEQEDPLEKTKKTTWLEFYCAVLDFAKNNKQLLEAMIALLNILEKETNPQVKEQKMSWIAQIILNCRVHKMDKTTFFKKLPLFSALLDLRDPTLRSSLIKPFIELLKDPALSNTHDEAQEEHLQIVSMLLGPYGKISDYEETIRTPQKGKTLSYVETTKRTTFKERVKEFLGQKFFRKDKEKRKSLLHSLYLLTETTQLTATEKMRILRDLIFAKNPDLEGRAQSEQLLLSAQIVAQLIGCGEWDRLKRVTTPQELQDQVKEVLANTLQLDVEDFTSKFFKTFGSWRKPEAILTYVSTMQTLNPEDKEKIMPFLKIYVESVLNGTFADMRYDTSKEGSEHMIKLFTESPELLEKWKKKASFPHPDYLIEDTDDPCDLLLCGTEVGSCQRIENADSKNLISYLLDGKIRLMVIKNKQGVILSRCILRLLWDDTTHQFVLFQEMIYPWGRQEKFSKILDTACIERAKQLNVPLFLKEEHPKSSSLTTLTAFRRKIPFEMVDSANLFFSTTEGYTISGCSCIYSPSTSML